MSDTKPTSLYQVERDARSRQLIRAVLNTEVRSDIIAFVTESARLS